MNDYDVMVIGRGAPDSPHFRSTHFIYIDITSRQMSG